MKLIKFRSNRENYGVECEDIKNNTSRFTIDWTKKRWGLYKEATHIEIQHTLFSGRRFIRQIRHKCKYKNIIVITWIPKFS